MGSYAVDSHDSQRYALPGSDWVHNEGDHCDLREEMEGAGRQRDIGGLPPWFEIPYRSLVPQRSEVVNLLVPVGLSSSHVGFAAVRLEPTWMALGQAAGMAAHLALGDKDSGGQVVVQDVDVNQLQSMLRGEAQVVSHTDIGPAPENVCPAS